MNENNKNALGLPNQANVSKAMFAYIIDFLIDLVVMLLDWRHLLILVAIFVIVYGLCEYLLPIFGISL